MMLLDLSPEEVYQYIDELNQEAENIKENMFDIILITEGSFSLNDVAVLSNHDKKILNKSLTKYNNEIQKKMNGKTTLTNNY